jgi:hypothetical protein
MARCGVPTGAVVCHRHNPVSSGTPRPFAINSFGDWPGVVFFHILATPDIAPAGTIPYSAVFPIIL